MTQLKLAFSILMIFCLCGVSAVSANDADTTAYSVYDTASFSVEYPSNWDAERSLATELGGWEYEFINVDFDSVDPSDPDVNDVILHQIKLIIGADIIVLAIVSTLNTVESGYLDEPTQHFLDTLTFKNSGTDVANVSDNITYVPYDSVYFSVEHPRGWINDTTPYGDGIMYFFADQDTSNITMLSVRFGTQEIMAGQTLEILSLGVLAPGDSVSRGKFEEPVLHFFDTLMFKM